MTLVRTPAKVLAELAGVSERLAKGTETGTKRLALLRRQAELGDLRDAIADRARRRSS